MRNLRELDELFRGQVREAAGVAQRAVCAAAGVFCTSKCFSSRSVHLRLGRHTQRRLVEQSGEAGSVGGGQQATGDERLIAGGVDGTRRDRKLGHPLAKRQRVLDGGGGRRR